MAAVEPEEAPTTITRQTLVMEQRILAAALGVVVERVLLPPRLR